MFLLNECDAFSRKLEFSKVTLFSLNIIFGLKTTLEDRKALVTSLQTKEGDTPEIR